MRLLIQGKRFAGRVDQIPGVLYVATRFDHVYYVPLVPLGSYIILEESGEGGGLRGRKIELNPKSLLAAYGRLALLMGAAALFGFGLLLVVSMLLSVRVPPLAIVGSFLLSGGCLGGYRLSHRLLRASPKRALELAEMAGIDLAGYLSGVEQTEGTEEAEPGPGAEGEEGWRAGGYEDEGQYTPEPAPESYYETPVQSASSLYVDDRDSSAASGFQAGAYNDEPIPAKAGGGRRRFLGLTIPQIGLIAVILVAVCIALILGGGRFLDNLPALGGGDEATVAPPSSPLPSPTDTVVPTVTPLGPPILEPGWTLREHPENGLMVGLPSTWVELDIHANSMDEALAPLKECCPELDLTAPYWTEQSVIDLQMKGLRLLAIDPEIEPSGSYYGSINIVHRFDDAPWVLDEAVEAFLEEYTDQGIQITHRRVTLPVGEAEEFEYVEGVETPYYTRKYLLIQDDTIWFITMGCEEIYEEVYAPVFAQISQTFRWIDESTIVPTVEPISPSCPPGATFAADVSIPDGTELGPGESFEKTWRIRSSGCAPWPAGTRLVFVSGDEMGGVDGAEAAETPLGETADVTVQLTAPNDPGTYKGFWQMHAPDGTPFGDRFYVMIIVVR